MRIKAVLAAAGLVVGSLIAIPATSTATATDTTPYYLALGDSLSVGYQPGPVVAGDTNQGYSDDLYATLLATHPGLQLKKLGCSGETTASMINGGVCNDGRYAPFGSQLAAAVNFVQTHNVTYVTLDIGANDVDRCTPGGSINAACLVTGIATITQNLNTILSTLKTADGGRPISAGMTYYDPFLQYWLTGTQGQVIATASVGLLAAINTAEVAEYTLYGFRTADVFGAFDTLDFLPTLPTLLPANVATICRLTWECTPYVNIHANAAGYRVIAGAFARAVS
ncbi:MAG: SGNH/GDSL hydrolase family protein [Actinomycetota bacterium]|nr:SGNH/GDSL hydrolase family protein [Actinomycetota bacterium]